MELTGNISGLLTQPTWKLGVFSALCVPVITYVLTSMKSAWALSGRGKEHAPPIMPYWLPFFGNIFSFAADAPAFAAEITRKFGFSIPVRVRFGPFKAYFISSAEHFDAILKGAQRNLNSTPGLNLIMQTFFGLPKHVVPFYEADDSGIAAAPAPGSNVPAHHRINHLRFSAAQRYLNGEHLRGMTERFVRIFGQQLAENERITGERWTEMADLTDFLQKEIFRAATLSLCGPHLLRLNPTFVDDFWAYIGDIPVLYKGLPRWWNPKAHRARDRCLAAIEKWHKFAWENVDRSKDDDSVAWEPYFGARIMRTRYKYAMAMEATSHESRAAEDLAMIFAANANAVPATIYFITEFVREPSLLARAQEEIAAARIPESSSSGGGGGGDGGPRFDLAKLCEAPLLQSVFAETLRLRIAVILMRSPEKRDFKLGRWLFRKGELIFLCSQTAATNQDMWNAGTAEDPHPLDEFWAERFLVYDDDPTSGPVKRKKEEEKEAAAAAAARSSRGRPRFSMEGTAGGWVPFGGGVRMCPGRFFAKNEMMAALAMICTSFDIELRTPAGWKPEPDRRYFLVGALPPKGEIPFRIRRRR